MARTDKDAPFVVRKARGEIPTHGGWYFYWSDSGFRKGRAALKRQRSKAIRRYSPESNNNGAKFPYSGLKRTWDFE